MKRVKKQHWGLYQSSKYPVDGNIELTPYHVKCKKVRNYEYRTNDKKYT